MTNRIILAVTLIFLVVVSWIGCKKDSGPVGPSALPEVIIPTTTKTVSQADFTAQFISISPDSSTFVFRQGGSSIDNLATNDVMVSDKGQGLLRKVISVTKQNGEIILQTTQANGIGQGHPRADLVHPCQHRDALCSAHNRGPSTLGVTDFQARAAD